MFDATSVWNKPLSVDPPNYLNLGTAVADLFVGFSTWVDSNRWSIPVVTADAEAPQVRVLHVTDLHVYLSSGAFQNTGNSADVEDQIRALAQDEFPWAYHTYVTTDANGFALPDAYDPITNPENGPRLAYAPAGACPALNPDGQMVIVQPDGSVLETFSTIILSDGTIVCQSYKVTDPTLAGDGWQNGTQASMIPVYAGLITQEDLDRGSIDHAIKIIAPASILNPSSTYPASTFDRGALTENPAYGGELPMGSILAIPSWIDIDSLGLTTDLGRAIAAAAQQHGFIITDRGGSGVTVGVEASANIGPWEWNLQSDLNRIMDAVQRALIDESEYGTSEALLANPDLADETSIQNGTEDRDVLVGHDGPAAGKVDHMFGNGGSDDLHGLAGEDVLRGGAGDDLLDGGSGGDRMVGGTGNDTFKVDNALDRVEEYAGSGYDKVISTVAAYVLGANLEALELRGAALVGTGNGGHNTITGNERNNTLSGAGGNDILRGGAGNDVLMGEAGRDTLDGGLGNDTYILGADNDVVVDAGGIDTLVSTISRDLRNFAAIENLTLAGGAAANGIGNARSNSLVGNAAANVLVGLEGNDTLTGGLGRDTLNGGIGNDTYVLENGYDVVIDSAGIDTITSTISRALGAYPAIENLRLHGTASIGGTGNALNNAITGNSGNNLLAGGLGNDILRGGDGRDTLVGGPGNDVLSGGSGADRLIGGLGCDRFDFDSIAEIGQGAGSRDIISDFTHAVDRIDLSTIDAVAGPGNQAFTFVAAEGAAFTHAAGELVWDRDNRVGFINDATFLRGDVNGDGVMDFELQFTGLVTLTAVDFLL